MDEIHKSDIVAPLARHTYSCTCCRAMTEVDITEEDADRS